MTRSNRLRVILAAVVILAVGAGLLSRTRPANAQIGLETHAGDAAWFYRSCSASGPATWQVEPEQTGRGPKSLSIAVQNAYPGYILTCDLYLANTGDRPLKIEEISLVNPNAEWLRLQAVEDPLQRGKTLKPCGFTPDWGTAPTKIPSVCQTRIQFRLAMGPDSPERTRVTFAVLVGLVENFPAPH